MSLFGKKKFRASFDPLGDDRGPFEEMARYALDAYIRRSDINEASRVMEAFTNETAKRFTEWHPDVGRSSLLLALILSMQAEYGAARAVSNSAAEILKNRGDTDFDLSAARYLAEELERQIQGERKDGEPAIISEGTPIGRFFIGLK